jgi:hypothetical protein
MEDWVPFKEGEYLAERAFLLAADDTAILVEDAIISVFLNRRGQRQLNGLCRVRNVLMVDMLDEHDDIDLVLDFGEEFKYLLKTPALKAGKVFAPDVKSTLQFVPREPWTQLAVDAFEALWSRSRFLGA